MHCFFSGTNDIIVEKSVCEEEYESEAEDDSKSKCEMNKREVIKLFIFYACCNLFGIFT